MKIIRNVFINLVVLLLFLCVGTLCFGEQPHVGKLTSYTGTVQIFRDGNPLSVVAQLPLKSVDKISTGDDGKAEICFKDGMMMKVNSNTDLTVEETSGKKKRIVRLLFGRIVSIINPAEQIETEFQAGNTVAAIHGTYIEEEQKRENGETRLGCVKGEVCLSALVAGQAVQVCIKDGQSTSALPDQAPSQPEAFKAGDIYGELAYPETSAQNVLSTQGAFALSIVRDVGIDDRLPDDATEADAVAFLQKYGITPCRGYWQTNKPFYYEDYCYIFYGDCCADCEYLSPNELKRKLLETYPDLFWLINQPRFFVSPFAP